jgi:hypothetical protein
VRLLLVPLAKTKPWLGATKEEGPEVWATAGSVEGSATTGTKEPTAAAVVVGESTASVAALSTAGAELATMGAKEPTAAAVVVAELAASVATLSTAAAELAAIGVKDAGAAPAAEVATTADVTASAAPAAVVDPPTTWVKDPIT